MNKILRAAWLLPIFALAACTSTGSNNFATTVPVVATAPTTVNVLPTPAQSTAAALQTTDASGFVDQGALALMTPNDKAQASSAQFYAMQFGRPGAPRNWSGDKGTKGNVTVGPYVRVNNLDCRDYTHTVSINGQDLVHKGTACRETDGRWAAVS